MSNSPIFTDDRLSYDHNPKVTYAWIAEAWRLYKKSSGVWLVVTIMPILSSTLFAILFYIGMYYALRSIKAAMDNTTLPGTPYPYTAMHTTLWVLIAINGLSTPIAVCCASDIALRVVRGEAVPVKSLFKGVRLWPQTFLFSLLWTVCCLVGSVLCGVGGFVASGYLLQGFARTAAGDNAWKAASLSAAQLKHQWLQAALFSLVFLLMYIAGGLLTCTIGAYILCPMAFIISALAYRDFDRPAFEASSGLSRLGETDQEQPGVWPPAPEDDIKSSLEP